MKSIQKFVQKEFGQEVSDRWPDTNSVFLGNLIWLVFGGIWIFSYYWVAAFTLYFTIVGIPFGIQFIKLAHLSLRPFGKEVVDLGHNPTGLEFIINSLWFFFAGIWLCLHHLVWAFLLSITIIGLPFARQHIKLASLALMPFGKEIR